MTSANDLRDRATFEKQIEVPDGGGGHELQWVAQFEVAGQLMPGSVAERLEAGRLEASATAVLRIRNNAQTRTIKPDWRVIIDGTAHAIRSPAIDPHRRRQWLDLTVVSGVAT